MKILLFAFAFSVGFTCFAQKDSAELKLKNYAFCSCLAHSSNDGEQFAIRDGSSAGYLEITDYDLDVYKKIDSLAKRYAQKTYHSVNKKPLGLMKCLDFYNSRELAEKIKLFSKTISLLKP